MGPRAALSSEAVAGEPVRVHCFNKHGRWLGDDGVPHPELHFAPPLLKEGEVTRVGKTTQGGAFLHREGRDEEKRHGVTKGGWGRVW